MEVILREDIESLGTRGEVVKVAAGYARNFLLPKRLAVAATDSNRKIVEQEKQAHLRKEAKLVGEAQELARLVGRFRSVSRAKRARTISSSARLPPATSPTFWPHRSTQSNGVRFSLTSRSERWESTKLR